MRFIKLITLLFTIILLASCSKDENPTLKIKTVSLVLDNDGAIVTGEILKFEKEPIEEYGFMCLPKANDNRNAIKFIVVGTTAKIGTFHGRLTSELLNGNYWAVAAYLRTENSYVYGNEIRIPER